MKKINYSYLPANSSSLRTSEKDNLPQPATKSKTTLSQPTEETIARLNAIAREYPFCAIQKHRGTMLL